MKSGNGPVLISFRPRDRSMLIILMCGFLLIPFRSIEVILTAEEKGLTQLLERALEEKSKITHEYQEIKRMIESNVSLSERMDKMAVLDYLKTAQKMSA